MKKIIGFIKKYLPTFALISFLITLASVILLMLMTKIPTLADFVNVSLAHAVRVALSGVSYIFPFSIFELLLLLIIPVTVGAFVLAFRFGGDFVRCVRNVFALLAVLGLIFTSYIFTLAPGYHTTTLAERMGLDTEGEISNEELYNTAVYVRDRANALSVSLDFDGGFSRSGYSLDDISRLVVESYELQEELDFIKSYKSRAKPVTYSGVMTATGITGIYSFFTGEANINMAYPDYCLPFTVAHELAHQRGISRENEANFVAYLICISSPDSYLQYSGYLGMYKYLANALYSSDRELYSELVLGVFDGVKADLSASYEVSSEHSGGWLDNLSDKMNDAYLKLNGTEGTVSYGLAVRLAVAYHR